MGVVYLRTLSDCVANGAIIAIECRSCDRIAYIRPHDLIDLKVGSRPIPATAHLAEIEHMMICRPGRGRAGCGAKNASIRAIWSHDVRGVPKGLPVLVWLNSDDRERSRLIAKARG